MSETIAEAPPLSVEDLLNAHGGYPWAHEVYEVDRRTGVRVLTALMESWRDGSRRVPGSIHTFRSQFGVVRETLHQPPLERGALKALWMITDAVLIPVLAGAQPLHLPPSDSAIRSWLESTFDPEQLAHANVWRLASEFFRVARDEWRTTATEAHFTATYLLTYPITRIEDEGVQEAIVAALYATTQGRGLTTPAPEAVPEVTYEALPDYLLEQFGDKRHMPDETVRRYLDMALTLVVCAAIEKKQKAKGLGGALRKYMRNLGFDKFTGGTKRALDGVLASAMATAPTEITAEMWAKRYEAMTTMVTMRTSREGRERNWCAELDRILADLDMERTEGPPVPVEIEVSGYRVRVEVPAWEIDRGQPYVTRAAQARWTQMTDAERRAAIISRPDVPALALTNGTVVS